jgi:hypothetical protein
MKPFYVLKAELHKQLKTLKNGSILCFRQYLCNGNLVFVSETNRRGPFFWPARPPTVYAMGTSLKGSSGKHGRLRADGLFSNQKYRVGLIMVDLAIELNMLAFYTAIW